MSDSESENEDRVLSAKDVYLLMKKDYRISRNIRASWFFRNLNSVLEFSPETCLEETTQELTVVGVRVEEEAVVAFRNSPNSSPSETQCTCSRFRLVPSTVVHFVAKRYRLVFVLDFSPSTLSVDLKTGEVLADKIYDSLKKCLQGLVKPFPLPGTNLLFETELFITVIAHTPMVVCTTNQVLVQGIRVTAANVGMVLDMVRTGLLVFEQSLYNDINPPTPDTTMFEENSRKTDSLHRDQKPRTRNKSAELAINPEAGIINLLRQGFFALQLLPENSSAGIVVVTDGMLGVTDLNLFDSLLAQLRSSTIACSFLRIGQTQCARCIFGLVPHVELLQFIASATFGAYLGDPQSENEDYHRDLLIWSFQKSSREPLHFQHERSNICSYINVYAHPLKDRPDLIPIERKKQMDVKLSTSLFSVLSVRLREGFTLRNVILRGETQIKVELALLWRDYVKIEYHVTAAWPADHSKQQLSHVEMFVEGSYDFLHDAFSDECALKQARWSSIRNNSIKKFLIALTKLRQSDLLLTHLQSFPLNPVNYKLPDSIKNGLSLFYTSQQSSTPNLNAQHNTKDAVFNQFVNFWKPVVHLDTKIWQKWMHSHRIGMVLEHDTLSKYLHIPDSCGRFNFVFCRQAQLALQTLLQSWSTFVLVENTAYVKYLYEGASQNSKEKEKPTHFLLLRLSTSKLPCLTIKAAFLGGTSGSKRFKVLKELKAKVFALKFKQGGSQIDKSKKFPKVDGEKAVMRKPPLDRDGSETPCCVMLTKPMENILISYERVPSDMTILEDPSRYFPSHMTSQQIANKTVLANAFNTLSRYLYHQRWIWTIKQGKVDISMQAVGRILSTLTKIRLQEGFHFASSNSGIINMVLETDMKHPESGSSSGSDVGCCVVQYVMFPPQVKTSCTSVSEDEIDMYELTEADGDLQIVTECWVEPQYGVVVNSTPERQHWEGLTYKQIARAFYPKDLECVSSLVTFENLQYVCQNPAVFEVLPWLPEGSNTVSSSPYDEEQQKGPLLPNIHLMPLVFDVLSLVPRSQQAEMLFSSFTLVKETDETFKDIKGSNNLLLSLLFDKMKDRKEREIPLNLSDSKRFLQILSERPRNRDKYPFDISTFNTSTRSSVSIDPNTQSKSSQTEMMDEIPLWKCFVSSACTSKLFMKFIPASYEDLLKLHSANLDTKQDALSVTTDSLKDTYKAVEKSQEIVQLTTERVEEEATEEEVTTESETDKEDTVDVEEEAVSTSYVIPVYVYECQMNNITDSLVNPWNYANKEDLFEDVTFERDEEVKNPVFKKLSVDVSPDIRATEGEGLSPIRPHHERRTTENSDTTDDLMQQCIDLKENYCSSFLNGVFQSLQQGFPIDRHDIEAAINNICEETNPIEIDTTSFLHASCRHFQQLLREAETTVVVAESAELREDGLKRQTSVRFADEVEGELQTCQSVPSALQIPRGRIRLVPPTLSEKCETYPGLHDIIRNKFLDIVNKWFKVVPSAHDYYFYCPDYSPMDNNNEDSDTRNVSDHSDIVKSEAIKTEELLDDSIGFQELEQDSDQKNNPDLASIASQLDSNETLSLVDSDYDFCEEIQQAENDDDSEPLFLHFTCTVKSGIEYENISVKKLVPCIEEFCVTEEISAMELNLSDLKITLDINCLTSPSEVDFENTRRPSYFRVSSYNSVSSEQSPRVSECENTEVESSYDPGHQTGGDPLANLPVQQHNAVIKCKEEVEWLLKDEVASSLRHRIPIKRDALQYVTEHIKNSAYKGKPTCSFESIPLHFVYGSECSLNKFREEFERLHMHGFRLIKEEDFYFAVRLKSHVIGQALKHALVELSKEITPATQSASLDSLPDQAEFSFLSKEAGVLRTSVPPRFSSPEAFRNAGHQRQFSSDVSGSDEYPSPAIRLDRVSFEKQISPGGTVELHQRKEITDSNFLSSDSKQSDSRRNSKESSASQTFCFSARKDSNAEDSTSESASGPSSNSEAQESGIGPLISSKPFTKRYDSISDEIPDTILKKSSSFAGFHNEQTTETFSRQQSVASVLPSVLPIKPFEGAPQLPSLGRLRHSSAPSGHGTPRSKPSTVPQTPSWISSRGSYTEEGYEGGTSDSEDGTTALSDVSGLRHPFPEFWLILQVKDDCVDMYYHSRETGLAKESGDLLEQRKLLSVVKKNIEALCRKVNQLLLLNDLYETRMCKKLLVAEADEDVSWNVVDTIPGKPPSSHSEDEEDTFTGQQYLAAENKYLPGHFECESVMTHRFVVHPRLKTGPAGRSNVSRGVQVLRTVLNKFSVNNRKNMFVVKELVDSDLVYYLRLQEVSPSILSRQVSSISTEDIGLCDSSSSQMFAARRDEMTLASDKDTDSISVTSIGSSTQRLLQDLIVIDVYGVQPAGTKLQLNLMDMLQRKLDDAVLEIISLQLSRNPNIKLMPDDIRFIQKPMQDVSHELLLTIPSILPIPLCALMYYLKQNMSQFSHAPNYADNKPENRFQDKIGSVCHPISDDEVFLYIRPHSSGGKGIACVSVSLVDGQRHRVSLLRCPKPSRTNYSKVETLEEFDCLTHTVPFSPRTVQKPGPTALVQFRVWERGSADLDTLNEKLIGAMKHALNDVIMEYYFLTSSICLVPHQLQDILPTPALSAPSSPVVTKESVEKRPTTLSRKNSVEISTKVLSTSKTAPSPLQFVKDTFGSTRSRFMSPPPDSSTKSFEFPSPVASPTVTSGGSVTEKMSDKHHIIRLYEEGERGSLCPIFTDQMAKWLDYCYSQGTPAVNKLEQTFKSRLSLNQFMMEFQSLVKTASSGDICPRIFRQEPDHPGQFTQYNPFRKPLHAEEKYKESSLDFKHCYASTSSDASFILIGRNVDQWQASIQDMGEDEMADINMRQSQRDKAFPKQSFQRFAPYLSEKPRRESLTDQPNQDSIEMSPIGSTLFIPRQRLLFVLLNDKKLTLYTYNWAGDSTGSLSKSTTRLVQWQNARVSLLHSVIAQKMGLFHHCPFYNPNSNKKNPFAGSSTNLDDLIKCTAPPIEKVRRNNSMSTVVTSSYRAFDEVYKDLKPSKPLQHTEFSKMSDTVKQQCYQTQDLKLQDRKEIEKLEKLRSLYLLWMQKSTANMSIKEDILHLLKQVSRLLHYCATPLLFDPVWRRKVMKKYEVTQRQLSVSSPTEKVRSRHSSGQSVSSLRAMRTNSQEGLKKRPVVTPTDSPVNQPRHQREEAWHIELRHTFLKQYIKYVQSLGFVLVSLQPNLHAKGTHKRRSSYEKLTVHAEDHPSTPPPSSGAPHSQSSTCYLHKAMPAGILLLKLSFREQYFCVEMYVCENTRLGIPVNKHLKLLFVDECEKCKDIIHVHSFAHDFHLRCIQSCIQPDQSSPSFFRPQYHLTGFLRDFMQVYPYPPKFSRNFLSEDTVSISNLSTNGSDLYNFMVQNNKLIELKKFEMIPSVDPEIENDFFFVRSTEFALVSQKTESITLPPKGNKPQCENYFVGLVITHNPNTDTDRQTLKLNYFIVLTSQAELFPTDPVESKSGEFKAMVLQELSDRTKVVPVKQHISVRKAVQKFQKISKIHNLPLYKLLENERDLARQKIDDMIERSEVKCRKDSLWQRMLIGGKSEEKDNLQKLEFEEFLELLGMSVQMSLDSIDAKLIPFLNMNFLWYSGLFKKLQAKYPDTHRCFTSSDGLVQYIVILNPNYLDMFSMLMTNAKDNRTFLGAVYRDSLYDQVDTEECPNLPVRSVNLHLEEFVNVCSFHLWSSML